jgi:transposase
MSGHSAESGEAIVLETRRRRTGEEKQAILSELERPGAKVSAVARRHGLSANVLFRWRRDAALKGEAARSAGLLRAGFLPEVVKSAGTLGGIIEIDFSSGVRVRVDASFDAAALKCVIEILREQAVRRSLQDEGG